MKKSRALLLTAALVSLALPLSAARVRRVSLDELRTQSERIIIGQVIGSSVRDGAATSVWTDYDVRVIESLKGKTTEPVVRLSFVGGTTKTRSMSVAGTPRLQIGKTYVLFTDGSVPDLPAPTFGWGQGIYTVEEATVSGKKTQLLVSYDGEPFQIDERGRLVRGWAVRVNGGRVEEVRASGADPQRVEMTSIIKSDNSIAPAPQMKRTSAAPVQRKYATLQQLREFVSGKLESGEASVRIR